MLAGIVSAVAARHGPRDERGQRAMIAFAVAGLPWCLSRSFRTCGQKAANLKAAPRAPDRFQVPLVEQPGPDRQARELGLTL